MYLDVNIGCHFNLMENKLKHQFWSICELPIRFKCWFRTFRLKDMETRKVIKILLQQNSASAVVGAGEEAPGTHHRTPLS